MKFILDEESLAEALIEWAEKRINLKEHEDVRDVVIVVSDEGTVSAEVDICVLDSGEEVEP